MKSKTVELYECGKCQLLHRQPDGAEKCCICGRCGEESDQSFGECAKCRDISREERFQKNVKYVPFDPAMVYCHNDTYFFDMCPLDHFCDTCESIDEWPEYLETTEKTEFKLDPTDVLENALSDHYEDAYDALVDVDGFEKFITAWAAKQTMTSYFGRTNIVTKLSDFPGYEDARAEFIKQLEE